MQASAAIAATVTRSSRTASAIGTFIPPQPAKRLPLGEATVDDGIGVGGKKAVSASEDGRVAAGRLSRHTGQIRICFPHNQVAEVNRDARAEFVAVSTT